MSQAECPQSQIGGSVGNTTQTVLYSMNCLFNKYLSGLKLSTKEHNLDNSLQKTNCVLFLQNL